MLPFLTFMADLTFGNIVNITGQVTVGESPTCVAIAHVQEDSFLQMRRRVPFRCRVKLLEESCNYPEF